MVLLSARAFVGHMVYIARFVRVKLVACADSITRAHGDEANSVLGAFHKEAVRPSEVTQRCIIGSILAPPTRPGRLPANRRPSAPISTS